MSKTNKMEWVEYRDVKTGEFDSIRLEPMDKISISIFRHIGDRWFMAIEEFGLYSVDLETESLEEAKKRAIEFVRKSIERRVANLRQIYNTLNNVEFEQ